MKTAKLVRHPIATWWRIETYAPTIKPLSVVYFTASFVTYLEEDWFQRSEATKIYRERRESRDDIFPTFAMAKQESIERASGKVKEAENELQRRRTFLGQVESITEPIPSPSPTLIVHGEGEEK